MHQAAACHSDNPVAVAARLAADVHTSTWTTVNSNTTIPDTALHHTTTGTKAGDPLADLTFNLSIARFLTDPDAALRNLGLPLPFSSTPQRP